jgi:two-component system chemotaxis response regulator CheB
VVGGSAGAIGALAEIVAGLPADLPAAVFVVIHIPANPASVLPQILARQSELPSAYPGDGDRIERGRIYVAPPDHHLIIAGGSIRLTRGPRENGHRPAIDPLFRSAARAHGRRVVAIVLSGNLGDGSAGLREVTLHGGVGIVQDPAEALYPDMPRSALEHGKGPYCLPVAEIGAFLTRVVRDTGAGAGSSSVEPSMTEPVRTFDDPVAFGCPECDRALREEGNGDHVHFRCHVGHVFSAESLIAAESDRLERAMWTALRCLEENAALARRMATHARQGQTFRSARRFEKRATDLEQELLVVREALEKLSPPPAQE